MGDDDAPKRSRQSNVGLQSRQWTVPDRGPECRLERRRSRWIGPRWNRASASHGSRSAPAIPWFAAAMLSTTIRPGIRARRDCGRIHPTTPNRMPFPSSPPIAHLRRLLAPRTGSRLWESACRRDSHVFTAPPNPADFTGTILAQDTNFKQGRIQQFNVNVEQEIPGHIVLTAGYAGSRSSHILEFGNNINVSSPTACGTVTGYTLGCGPGGCGIRRAISRVSLFVHPKYLRRRPGALQFSADQSRDQERAIRHLCAHRIHLFASL